MNVVPFSQPFTGSDPLVMYVSSDEKDNESCMGYIDGKEVFSYLPLSTFLSYYITGRGSHIVDMNYDFGNIRHCVEDLKGAEGENSRGYMRVAYTPKQLDRIERVLHTSFPETKKVPLNKMIVTDQSIQILFPALIQDSPVISSKRLNCSLWVLPLQITELFVRTILDGSIFLGLSIYGLADQDRAEYLKVRLSITHNNSFRAIWTNIYKNL